MIVKQILLSYWQRPGFRYVVTGGSVYVLELAVILSLTAGGMANVPAVAIAFWSGLVVSFVVQKVITFGDKRTGYRIISVQAALYGLLVLFNFCFTLVVTALLAPPLPGAVCRTIALLITTVWNFYLYRTRIFTKDTIRAAA